MKTKCVRTQGPVNFLSKLESHYFPIISKSIHKKPPPSLIGHTAPKLYFMLQSSTVVP